MTDLPNAFFIPSPSFIPSRFDAHLLRNLSALKGQFLDQQAHEQMLVEDDRLIYEVYEIKRPEVDGELLMGISILHPGKVGSEFFMTKGHFHDVLETSEMYYCLAGEGFMVMENPEGETCVEVLVPGKVLYVPPRWAHRSVCTSRQVDLVTFFVYPAHSGHDYGSIEQQGFRKLVVEGDQGVQIIDNPRWRQG
jgi:glucose-6-phosphate isomerase, archaeal